VHVEEIAATALLPARRVDNESRGVALADPPHEPALELCRRLAPAFAASTSPRSAASSGAV
jgi:hypothetical protein